MSKTQTSVKLKKFVWTPFGVDFRKKFWTPTTNLHFLTYVGGVYLADRLPTYLWRSRRRELRFRSCFPCLLVGETQWHGDFNHTCSGQANQKTRFNLMSKVTIFSFFKKWWFLVNLTLGPKVVCFSKRVTNGRY